MTAIIVRGGALGASMARNRARRPPSTPRARAARRGRAADRRDRRRPGHRPGGSGSQRWPRAWARASLGLPALDEGQHRPRRRPRRWSQAHGTPRAHHSVQSSARPRSVPDQVPSRTTVPWRRSARSATSRLDRAEIVPGRAPEDGVPLLAGHQVGIVERGDEAGPGGWVVDLHGLWVGRGRVAALLPLPRLVNRRAPESTRRRCPAIRPARASGRLWPLRATPPVPAPVIGASLRAANQDQPWRRARRSFSGGNRTTAAPSGHGSGRRWGDSAPGTCMPGAAVCADRSWSEFAEHVATGAGGPYRASLHGCIAPRRHSPNRRRSAVPGPRPVAPHAVPGGPGHLPRIAFHISLAGWRILASMAATAVHVRSPQAGARAAAATRRRRSPRRSRARGRRRRLRDHLRPLLPRPARLLRAHARQSPGGGGRPAAQLRLGVPGAARRRRRHRPAPVAVHDRAQPLPVGAARAARARSPPTGSRPRPARSRAAGPDPAARRPARPVDELQRLPDDQRAALVLFELGDESHEQIAAVLGVRREKVKALVFQAREALLRARTCAATTPCAECASSSPRVTRRASPRRSLLRAPHRASAPSCSAFARRGPPPARRVRRDHARRPDDAG